MTDFKEATMQEAVSTSTLEATIDSAETATMTAPRVNGNWNEQKSKLKAQYSSLSDTDLHYDNGKKDEMFTKIAAKLGKTKEELSAIIAAL